MTLTETFLSSLPCCRNLRPELSIVSWSEWKAGHTTRIGSFVASTVTSVERIFEDHISVRDLERSIGFYRDVLGMEVGLLQSRSVEGMGGGLLWVGGRGHSMLGIFVGFKLALDDHAAPCRF